MREVIRGRSLFRTFPPATQKGEKPAEISKLCLRNRVLAVFVFRETHRLGRYKLAGNSKDVLG